MLLVAAAVVAALGSALVFLYVRGADNRAQEKFETTDVLVATVQIERGERIADAVLKRVIGQPVEGPPHSLDVREDARHHEHDRRSAAVIERTLRNGIVHPDVLHRYSSGVSRDRPARRRVQRKAPKADTPNVRHFVQYGATDIHYPHGHLQGYGFVPRQHEAAKHILLEPAHTQAEALPASTIKGAQAYA